jgi:hypothetical protein
MLSIHLKFKTMLEKFRTQIIENPQNIQGGADSQDIIITDDLG